MVAYQFWVTVTVIPLAFIGLGIGLYMMFRSSFDVFTWTLSAIMAVVMLVMDIPVAYQWWLLVIQLF
jgi:hypothetical protein